MAFSRTAFYQIGSGAGPIRHWRYDTTDTANAVDTAGYFNGAANELKVGDLITFMIWTTAIYTGTPGAVFTAVVNSNAAGVVDTADQTSTATATDTR